MKKLIIFFLLVLPVLNTTAQTRERNTVILNLQQADQKLIHFGFILGLHTQDFAFTPSEAPDKDGIIWYPEIASPAPGFTVGIISDLRLGEYFNLRFTPSLNFGDRSITFAGFKDGVKVDEYNTTVLSTLTSFPLEIKYRAKRRNNYRPYLIAGGGATIDFSRKKDLTILLKPADYFISFGVGCDFYLPYFKLSPELKMCIGFNNMIDRDRNTFDIGDDIKYTDAIAKMTSRLLMLTFNFE